MAKLNHSISDVPRTKLRLRRAGDRGQADHGWLKSAHSFSFAGYNDPAHVHFESLRVINDDRVAGGHGFPAHPHRDFEIFSYVLDGALEHRDSLGNGSVVKAGGVQYMSAGSGVTHSEFNPSHSEPVHFLQVWLIPDELGSAPRYQTLDIRSEEKRGKLRLFLSADGRGGSIAARQDVAVYAGLLDGAEVVDHEIADGRKGWIQVARGSLAVNGVRLGEGDGLAVEESGRLRFSDGDDAEFLLFDLAPLR